MENKPKSKAIFMLIGVMIVIYIVLVSIFVSSTNDFIIPASNTNEIQQRAYIVEQESTYIGSGQFGSFPVFTNYMGIASYNGSTISNFLNKADSNYFITITSGALANTTVRLTGFRLDFNVIQLMLNYSQNQAIQNEFFEIYETTSNAPIRGFVSVYDNIFLGQNNLNIGFGGSSLKQSILYWDGTGTFIAGKLENAQSTTIGQGSIALGSGLVVAGTGGLALNGRVYEDTTFSSGISGGWVFSSFSTAIGSTTNIQSDESVVIGKQGTIEGDSERSVILGYDNRIRANSSYSVIIGTGNFIGTQLGNVTDENEGNIAIGSRINIEDHTTNAVVFHTGKASYGLAYDYNISNSITFGVTNTTTNQLLQLEYEKGVRIGAITGESITMDGDDLYVAGNQETDGFLVLGTNTENGLSAGDINASTIYYDTLTAKSPIVLCSEGIFKCFVIDVEAEKEYYIFIDEDYNILDSKNKLQNKKEDVSQKVKDKFTKLKAKKQKDDAYKLFLATCDGENQTIKGKECIETNKFIVTYNETVEIEEVPVYSYRKEKYYELNSSLHKVEKTKTVQDKIVDYENIVSFKKGCGWNKIDEYYCLEETIINAFS